MEVKGIDVSYCQEGMDLAKAKAAGVKFCIIRAGHGTKEDHTAAAHVKACKANGIDVGFYWYSYAKTVEDAKREAAACLAFLKKNDRPVYPVWFDAEESGIAQANGREITTDIALSFIGEIEKGGYPAGIYANPAYLEQYYNKTRVVGKVDIWLAHWTESPAKKSRYSYGQKMWQWGLDKSLCGGVDGDLCFVDYPAITAEFYKSHGSAKKNVTYAKLSDLVGTKSAWITTTFKEKGSYWASGWHNGVDIAAGLNTQIYAAADGVVINADSVAMNNDGFGNRVVLRHADGKATVYAHMIAPAPVKVGQTVKKGQLIGNVGSTGLSTGAHLHFTLIDNYDRTPDIYYKGDLLDPVAVLGIGTLKYSSSGSMSAAPATPARTEDIEIGDIVRFKGGSVYITSTAKAASATKGASRCKVSNIYNKGKHPYHLISEDGKGVYGWVDASDVESVNDETTSGAATAIVKVGDIVQFKGGGVYVSASAAKASATRGESRCKVTITNSAGKHPYHLVSEDGKGVYGWVDSVNVTK